MINPETLALWKRLADEATSGPWDSYFETGLNPMVVTYTENEKGLRSLKDAVVHGPSITNNNFIAAARTAVPALIAEVERLDKIRELQCEELKRRQEPPVFDTVAKKNKEIARLRKQLEKCREQRDMYRKDARDEFDLKLAIKTDDAEIEAIGKVGE